VEWFVDVAKDIALVHCQFNFGWFLESKALALALTFGSKLSDKSSLTMY